MIRVGLVVLALISIGSGGCGAAEVPGEAPEPAAARVGALTGRHYSVLLEVAGTTAAQKTIIGGFKSLSVPDSGEGVLELGHGMVNDLDLLRSWQREGADGVAGRRNGTLTVLDGDVYRLVGARLLDVVIGAPVPSEPAAASGDVSVEKMELAVEFVEAQ